MPSTIPYDPSLTLGSIVPKEKLDNIIQMATVQAPADAAEATLNAMITLKRSVDMTVQERINLGIDPADLLTTAEEQNKAVSDAAKAYATAKIAAEKALAPLRAKIFSVSKEIESPIDYNRSVLKQMPLSADSLQMNVQYFSYDSNSENSNSHAATIATFVSDSLSIFGDTFASQGSSAASSQVNSQHNHHSIAGTLVLCVTCTHKTAQVFAPFILDPDKAVRAWNALYPDSMIKTDDPASILKIQASAETADEKSFSLLSGATYGSSFVGMVHVLDTTDTVSSQEMESIAGSMQEQFEVGGWFADESGGFGVDASFSDSAKKLLSTHNIQSHCSAIAMGIIPSIKSNTVAKGLASFADSDPGKEMQQLAVLQGATAGDSNSMAAAASAARTGQQMVALQTTKITAALSQLNVIDQTNDNILDTNSLMTALDDYVQKCASGGNNVGVPINYFLKPITAAMIARTWLAKYYPNKWNKAGSADDSNAGANGTNASAPAGGQG
jgi:hypothetical protein